MSYIRNVIFIGEDLDYLAEGQSFFKIVSTNFVSYQFLHIIPEVNLSLYSLLKTKDCLLVILDFTHQHANHRSWANQIRILKGHKFLKQVVFVGLFKSKNDIDESQESLNFGLNYFHVKGNDISQLFKDAYYISYEGLFYPESYARVKDVSLPYEMSIPAFVSRINSDGFKINCDLEANTNNLKIKFSFLENIQQNAFEIVEQYDGAEVGNNLNSYDLAFPYPGAWEEKDQNSLDKQNIQDWYENHPTLLTPTRKFLIWTEQEELFEALACNTSPFDHDFIIDQISIKEKLKTLQPEVIIIDLPDEHSNNYKDFFSEFLIDFELGSDPPLLVIFNFPLSSQSFKLEFNYEKVLCHEQKCEFETLDLMLKMYSSKINSKPKEIDYKCFETIDLNAYVEVKIPVIVTSLTEHEITFFHEKELAMFSILKIDVPTECYILIIPPYWKLDVRENNHHHMALIMGLDHKEAMFIRTFVNQAIFKPLKKFEKVTIQLTQKNISSEIIEDEESKLIQFHEEPAPEIFRKKTYKRSKL